MPESQVPEVTSSTKVWIGSGVTTFLGVAFGVSMAISGSVLTWSSDNVLGLYSQTGWGFHNITRGDGRITLAFGLIMAVGFLVGLVLQSRAGFMLAVVSAGVLIVISIYELIYIGTRQSITSPGHGLYLVLGGGVAGLMCSFCGYSMMAERHGEERRSPGGGRLEGEGA